MRRINDEPVLGSDLHETASCEIDFVLPTFGVLGAALSDLHSSSLHLAPDFDSNVDSYRRGLRRRSSAYAAERSRSLRCLSWDRGPSLSVGHALPTRSK